ncbi:Rhomboid family protein [Microbacterium sp. Root61]|uniref:rhomboid family intramembrane serine protease n=1 Tax=Microbacterium sp. Root61 TaxID=1736570 RepID=UPI0006F926C9|nr:rhomboid family intramembrane serine protease [Microbacterium sp. Root61]KRA25151.1 Rhomboid family protein [Microbacterium sp. Root61]
MSTDEFRRNRDNFCYRHPDRQSFVLCQRCLRTICPECQTQAAVGVICPECLKEQQKARTPAQEKAQRRWGRSSTRTMSPADSRPLVTYWIIGITVVVYLTQLIPGSPVQQWLALNSAYLIPSLPTGFQPWRLFTVLLVHSSIWHVGLNMLALWMIGRSLEPLLGRSRFLALYLISGLGGSVGVALLAPGQWVVGASGAIFGLFGALLVIGRHIGANVTSIAILIGINFAFPFVQGLMAGSMAAVQISWQAHLGGLIAGAAAGFIFARTRSVRQRRLQIILLAGLTLLLLALLVIPAIIYV